MEEKKEGKEDLVGMLQKCLSDPEFRKESTQNLNLAYGSPYYINKKTQDFISAVRNANTDSEKNKPCKDLSKVQMKEVEQHVKEFKTAKYTVIGLLNAIKTANTKKELEEIKLDGYYKTLDKDKEHGNYNLDDEYYEHFRNLLKHFEKHRGGWSVANEEFKTFLEEAEKVTTKFLSKIPKKLGW